MDDRLALRALVESYARNADRRRLDEMAALFCDEATLLTYEGDPEQVAPAYQRRGRADIRAALEVLHSYDTTTHFLGQQTVELNGDTATGETYCLAHHVHTRDGRRTLMVMAIRYLDRYARVGGEWHFAERKLAVDWREVRPLAPPGTPPSGTRFG
jgi:ketosteroid isomerase-like protein